MPIDPKQREKKVMKKRRKAKEAARKQQKSGFLNRLATLSPHTPPFIFLAVKCYTYAIHFRFLPCPVAKWHLHTASRIARRHLLLAPYGHPLPSGMCPDM